MLNKRLLKESKFKNFYIIAVILISLFNSLFIIISAYFLAAIVSGIFLKAKSLEEIKNYLILFILNAVFKTIINFISEIYIKNSSEGIKENFRKKLLELIISSNPYKVKNEKLGEIINILTEGTEMIGQYYTEYIPQFFSAFIIPLLICLGVASIDKLSALIMIITYPIIPLFMILIGYKSKEANEKQWKKLNVLSSHFIDMLQGLSTLKLFGISKKQEMKIFKISESHRKATMEVLKISFLSALVLELFATISTALVAVNLGLRLVYNQITFFDAFFILVLAPDFYLPVRQLGLKFHASLNGIVAIEKIEKLEEKFEEDLSTGVLEIEDNKFEIEVKGLNFIYGNKEILKDINFRINPDEKVALIGESGSGKSTLINILSGFLQIEDDMVFINGKDINNINKENYLRNITLVPQFSHIFNRSIEENVSVGYRNLDYKKLLEVYRNAKIDEFSEESPMGYKTIIGEGERLAVSGGEAQRISIARAMIKNSAFIIFDEPSSALDSEKEELLIDVIEEYFSNNTVLIAAHRLNTIKAANKIILLKEGQISEIGTHKELIERRGEYYKLMQSAEVEI
jgi:ATP-binding cassette subfamily C protein CydD